MQKHICFIEVARSHLDTLLRNNTEKDLDLAYPLETLSSGVWKIEHNIQTKHHPIYATKLTMDLLKESEIVATYIVYLNENATFIDEFFITQHS